MKNIVLKDSKKNRKVCKKVFTNKKGRDTIKKKCIPFKVSYKICKRREGLHMMNDVSLSGLLKELNFIEKIFFRRKFVEVYKKGIKDGFKWSNSIVR